MCYTQDQHTYDWLGLRFKKNISNVRSEEDNPESRNRCKIAVVNGAKVKCEICFQHSFFLFAPHLNIHYPTRPYTILFKAT